MKLLSLTPVLLFAVRAEDDPEEIGERKYKSIVKMAHGQSTTSYSPKEYFSRMQNYGCHCFPGQTRAAGGAGGAGVDEQDELCRQLARCHRCVSLEFDDIDVNKDGYKWELDGDNKIVCKDNNNAAKMALCQCDAKFSMDFGAMWDDSTFNEYYWLAPGQIKKFPNVDRFDYDDTCPQNDGAGDASGNVDACCGTGYPNMTPYNTAHKECCVSAGITFNAVTHECCGNGSVAAFGSCV